MTAYTKVQMRTVATESVADLVERAAGGDRLAWDALVDRFSRLVWSSARAYRLSENDAADVFQATWLSLLEHIDEIQEPDRLPGWLATTARRHALRVVRNGKRIVPTDVEPVLVDDDGIDTRLAAEERDGSIRRALASLAQRDRELLELLVADPRPSYEEISSRLDMPIGSIGPTRARALGRLRSALVLAGLELEDLES